jgi:hypothetical protein
LKTAIAGAKVSIARAVIGPATGMVCERRVNAPCLAFRAVAYSNVAIFFDNASI